MKNRYTLNDEKIANILRNNLFRISEPEKEISKEDNYSQIEYISKQKEEDISPILQMNEDQILDFVEAFDVSQLATLSVKELNYIGEKLGIEPKILFGLND